MTKPRYTFLIIGAQKGGTSALFDYLRAHPEIETPPHKEMHFFDNEEQFSGSTVDFSRYEKDVRRAIGRHRVVGEATPIYMYWKPAIERIHQYNPKMKLIAILRNPIDRAFSQWSMEHGRGTDGNEFLQSVREEIGRLDTGTGRQDRVRSYIERGLYAHQIRRVYRYFGDNQVLFFKYEQFISEQEETLGRIFDFLDVSRSKYVFAPKVVRKGYYSREISQEEIELLRPRFSDDIVEVEQLLGWDCSDWKT